MVDAGLIVLVCVISPFQSERQDEILDLPVRQQKAVLIDPVERQTEMRD